MKFIKNHPYLLGSLLIIIAGAVLQISFLWILAVLFAFFLVCFLLNLGTSLSWCAFYLGALFKLPNAAMKLYRKCEKLKWHSPLPMIDYGMRLLRAFEYEKAVGYIQASVDSGKLDAMSQKNAELDLAIAQWKCGKIDEALRLIDAMLVKYEIFSDSFNATVGYIFIDADDFENGEKFSRLALQENPKNAGALDNLGQIAYRSGDLENAEKFFKAALSIKSTLVDSNYYLGLTYEAMERYEEAAACFAEARKCPINGLNSITVEMVETKYSDYFSEH